MIDHPSSGDVITRLNVEVEFFSYRPQLSRLKRYGDGDNSDSPCVRCVCYQYFIKKELQVVK